MTQTLRYDFLNNPSLVPDTESPSTTPDLSITRATKATMVDADGYIREVQSGEARFTGATFSNNLLTQSEDTSHVDWTTSNGSITADQAVAPDGTTSGDKLVDDGGGGTGQVFHYQTIAIKVGHQYLMSVYAKADGLNWLRITGNQGVDPTVFYDLANGLVEGTPSNTDDAGIEAIGDGWYRCWILFTSDATSIQFRIYPANDDGDSAVDLDGTSSIFIWHPQFEAVSGMSATGPATYIPTTTVAKTSLTGTSTKGLLVEEARTNLALYNTDTSNAAWVASNVTKGSTSVTAPDGSSSTTVRLTASAGNGTLLQTVTSASATRAYSVYMKRVTGTGNIDLTVDGGSTWTTKTLTSEWQRFDITQAAVTNPSFGVRIVTSGDAIDFWGSQLENGAFATSLIYPTTTASVTRNADADVTPANVTWADASQGTFYVRASMANVAAADQPLLELSDASTSDRIHILCAATDGSLDLETDTTVGTDGDIAGTQDFTADTFSNAAVGYANDDCIVYLDGTSGGTEASATLPPSETLTKFLIGSNQDGEYGNCHISEIRFYNERSDALAENLSNGLFPIPDVVDFTSAGATTLLEANGFVADTTTTAYSDSIAVGNVISQDGAAGTYAANGTTVTLTISLGPEPSDATGGWLNTYNAYQQRKAAQEKARKEILQKVRELDGIDGEIAELMQLDQAREDEDKRIAEFRALLETEISKAELDKAGLLNARINRAYDRAMKKATFSAIEALEREIEDAIEEEEFTLLVLSIQ